MHRNRKTFSAYEMEILRQNPYTYRVRSRQIMFTAAFKEIFWCRYQAGDDVVQIFESLGYDPLVLGYTRMHSVAQNLRKTAESGREFTSGHSARQGTQAGKSVDTKATSGEVDALRHEVAYLRQHVEFLKKLTSPGSKEGRNN